MEWVGGSQCVGDLKEQFKCLSFLLINDEADELDSPTQTEGGKKKHSSAFLTATFSAISMVIIWRGKKDVQSF